MITGFPITFWGGGGGINPPLSLVTTDASTTPSTTLLTIPTWANAYQVWIGPTPLAEASFSLYRTHSGVQQPFSMSYRYSAVPYWALPGTTIALGTSDGRQVYISPVIMPLSLVAPSGTSGTANADAAGPPLWQPSSVHVGLAGNNQTIQLSASDATERVIFISEYSGSQYGWTQPCAYWLPATGNIKVKCTYRDIAIANYAGVAVSVTAPPGASIGGTSGVMNLTFQPVTGMSRVVTNGTQLALAIAAAVYGDEIVLTGTGVTYSLASGITETNFTANNGVGGHFGMEGITIRTATGNAADGIISFGATSNVWVVNNKAATGIAGFKNVSFSTAGNTTAGGVLTFLNGTWAAQNVQITDGPGTGNNDQIEFHNDGTTTAGIQLDMLACVSNNSFGDCYSGAGVTNSSSTQNINSHVRMINCFASVGGGAADDQLITSHTGLAYSVYGGVYSDANAFAFTNDVAGTPGYYFFTQCTPGTRQSGVEFVSGMYMCQHTVQSSNTIEPQCTNAYSIANHITITGANSSFSLLRNYNVSGGIYKHNYLLSSSGSGRACFDTVGACVDFSFNIVSGFSEGYRNLGYTSGSTVENNCVGNTFFNSPLTLNDTTIQVNLDNNAMSNASGTQITAGGATTTGNYNTFKNETGYTNGSNDTNGSNAAIASGTFLPTAAGNCDRNGDGANITWCGDIDPFGFVLIHKGGTPSRGARELSGVTSGDHVADKVWA